MNYTSVNTSYWISFIVKPLLLLLHFVSSPSCGFNIEEDYYVTHQGSFNTKFGFSIAQHRDASGNFSVIVGAPEAQTAQPNITSGGAVFRCHTKISNHCQMMVFDNKGNHHDGFQYINDKSHQWFGASVSSNGEVISACAPRYVWFSIKKNRREPIGRCLILIDERSNHIEDYSPCMNDHWGYHRQGTCQAGFGLTLTKGGNRLYVGAVGSWYWQGQVFYKNLLNKKDVLTISESPKKYDMSYLGFSMTSGYFDDDYEEDIAVGVPRGDELLGKVVIFTYDLKLLYNITGNQMGSYFGYSLAALDINGDGLQDIVVGSPWYADFDDPAQRYEIGMAACFMHTPQHNFRMGAQLYGEHSRSHFSLSLSSLKDLNRDGFDDLAIGAPGGGEQGSGAVYVYLGSQNGLIETPAQILYAEKIIHIGIRTFGWSLSGGQDLDGNDYPDLAIGAQESDRAYIFSSRPVVKIKASLKIKSQSGAFELKKKSCSLIDLTAVSCTPLQFCLSYTGHRVPSSLTLVMSITLDTNAVDHPRVFFLKHEGHYTINSSLNAQKDVQRCFSRYIYSLANPYDKLTPIHAELHYGISPREDSTFDSQYPHLYPTLSPPKIGLMSKVKDSIYFQNNCGRDNICIPDLSIKAMLDAKKYILGSTENLLLNLSVKNNGDDAYQAVVLIDVPEAVHFSKDSIIGDRAFTDGLTPFCTKKTQIHLENEPKDMAEEEITKRVICEVGNPLPSGGELSLQLTFQPVPEVMRASFLSFELRINSTNLEDPSSTDDNMLSLSLPVLWSSDVNVKGISWPEEVLNYNASFFGESLLGPDEPIKYEKEVGPAITHIYDVINKGPSDLPNVDVYLVWPSSTINGDPLLYLLEEPKISSDNLYCQRTPFVNYLDIEITTANVDLLNRSSFEIPSTKNSDNLIRHGRATNMLAANLLSENSSQSEPEPTQASLEELLSCGSTECSITRCSSNLLKASQHIFVHARSRLWADTVRKIGISDMKISSRLVIYSKDKVTGETKSWSKEVTSLVKTRKEGPIQTLSWLIWLGSCLVGLFLLALIILLLWILGFFKRRRPRDESEDELIYQSNSNPNL